MPAWGGTEEEREIKGELSVFRTSQIYSLVLISNQESLEFIFKKLLTVATFM